MNLFYKHATSKVCIINSIQVAILVGTVLALINHFDAIVYGQLEMINFIQIGITYLIPFSVAEFSAATHAVHLERRKGAACFSNNCQR